MMARRPKVAAPRLKSLSGDALMPVHGGGQPALASGSLLQ